MWRNAFLFLATANLILVSYSATHAENSTHDAIVASPAVTNDAQSAPPVSEPSSDFHEAIDNAVLDNKMENSAHPVPTTMTPAPKATEATSETPTKEPAQAQNQEASKNAFKPVAQRTPASKGKKKKAAKKVAHAGKHKKKKKKGHH